MTIFITSVFGAYIGATVVGSLGGNDVFIGLGAAAGFTLPYAIVLERIYNAIKAD